MLTFYKEKICTNQNVDIWSQRCRIKQQKRSGHANISIRYGRHGRGFLPLPTTSRSTSDSTALKATGRFRHGVEASSSNGSSNLKFASGAAEVLHNTPVRSGLLVAMAKSTAGRAATVQSRSRVFKASSPQKGSYLAPFLQGYWQNIGTSRPVRLDTLQRGFSKNIHSVLSTSHKIFLHPVCIFFFFLSTWKGNTKIWVCTGGRRRRASRVSQFSFSFF